MILPLKNIATSLNTDIKPKVSKVKTKLKLIHTCKQKRCASEKRMKFGREELIFISIFDVFRKPLLLLLKD
jgi:hypothetical protein